MQRALLVVVCTGLCAPFLTAQKGVGPAMQDAAPTVSGHQPMALSTYFRSRAGGTTGPKTLGDITKPFPIWASTGTNRLIQRGHAKLVLTVDDIVEELGLAEPVPSSVTEAAAPPPDLHPIVRQLYAALEAEPQHIDTLCQKTGHDASTALVYLLGLEFKGLVRQMAGKQFFRV